MIVQDVPAEIRTDPGALYEAAVADRRAGRHDAALLKLNTVLEARPYDVDARLNRGLSLLALNRLDEAEADFEAVLAVAPDYVDARLGLARVAQRRGNLARARIETERAALAAPDRADVAALGRALRPPPSWRVDLDVSRSRLGMNLPDWTEARLGAVRTLDERWTLGASGEWTERFGEGDLFLEGRVDRRFAWGGAYAALGGAMEADYRPETSLRAGTDIRITSVISGTLDATAARFASGDVTSLQPGLAADLAQGRVRVAARWINVWDETGQRRTGYALSAQWAAMDRLRLRLDHADAPETSEGVTVDVRALSVGAEIDLTDQVSLRLGALHEDRGAYDREAITLGLGWRFW
ncbi:MAG: YaiO family outer membrane beta-barrel protein [Brevundimonas sp.]|uniref:YaiO family outer membrane beta-barrel protein n=1 Tax=Brevundimonas sp. TaxID=1871086 RepID=UPI00391AEC6F